MSTNIHWFPGHMAKAIKQIDEQSKLIDLIIEIVDSRIPFSSANPLIDKLRGSKPKLIILNKKDLADPIVSKAWLNYYEQQQITVLPLDSKHTKINKIIVEKIYAVLSSKITRDKARGIKTPKLKVLVTGIPNVGKSTFINALVNRNSARVGNKPGVTKGQQWLKLNEQIDLIDTPGILWPKIEQHQVALNLAFTRAIKEDILPKEDVCLAAIKWMYQHYFSLLAKQYHLLPIDQFDVTNEVELFHLLLRMQQNRFHKVDEDNVINIVTDFLNKLWNNEFGLVSFEFPPQKEM
ncbi:ribosome biogenesis GTPase YlqF [Spiroplasma poulsonii]|uniref:Ribosome biogenesis GTPase A n=1 Tax=Spiroplasma poulsonii TaxID=2138 RepID=A0A3S0TZI6_9MOLU|nr:MULTISPECIES: ribosome biogenesis GTPase YlqF [Spiroplasma]MBH8622365.1 ribosome biogenesis GTPase YlqF [Spiroplasma sp. hyd1]MBW3058182.1 ribosome biogenesis GTPase YlqF [Spiroplasma poulsonii]RUP78291.1 ribosome biogenesis GTPase YlqF [Spiroplasma poulsonii]UNF61587.1 ribosome biogenesis GTPase YlqF [Spiroplasma poulsonii]